MARRDDRRSAGESSRDCVERWRPAGTIEIEISRARARAFDERLFDDLEQPMMSPAPQKSVNISSVRARVLSSSTFRGYSFFRPRFVCKDGYLTRILIKKVLFDSSGVRTHALSDENLNLAP